MKLIDKYNNLKKDYKDSIILIQSGIFYDTFSTDALIVSNIFNYQVINNKLGFPKKIIDNVKNKLNELHINYIIIENDNIVNNKVFDNNEYFNYYKTIKKCEYENNNKKLLLDRIIFLINDKDNYNKIKEFIDEF